MNNNMFKPMTDFLAAASLVSADFLAAASVALRAAPLVFETDQAQQAQAQQTQAQAQQAQAQQTQAQAQQTQAQAQQAKAQPIPTQTPPMPAKEPSDTVIISLEGNIGSGKSTLLEKLKLKYADDATICFLEEPVQTWDTIKDASGTTILENYYADQQKWAFAFQMMAYISRVAIMRAALKKKYRIIIIERSVYTDSAVFAKMLYDDKKIGDIEYTIYMKWVNEFIEDFPPIKFIYVRADAEVSHQRVLERGRPGEDIPIAYLKNCHKYHEDWLLIQNQSPLLMLDANMNVKNDAALLTYWLRAIDRFIKS
jgi:deoxyadenosine/deoxycytidine kinase